MKLQAGEKKNKYNFSNFYYLKIIGLFDLVYIIVLEYNVTVSIPHYERRFLK